MSDPASGHFREVMSRFPTGVTIVSTVAADAGPLGLTVNSFTSLSLDPALVLVCIDKGSSTQQRLLESSCFGVSILASHQAAISQRFARDPSEGRFDGLEWHRAPSGSPILTECAAWLECSLEEVLPGGDHAILVGRVEASGAEARDSLVFLRGRYGTASL